MFNTEFDAFAGDAKGLTFYPRSLQAPIDAINDWVYTKINNGVYRTGFATAQDAYARNCREVFDGLDNVEGILSHSQFLLGDTLTEADIRLFTTILRFDPVYVGHFKCNLKTIEKDYPSILRWARQIYQIPKVADTVNMTHIKGHYYRSHTHINPNGIVPLGNGPDLAYPRVVSLSK